MGFHLCGVGSGLLGDPLWVLVVSSVGLIDGGVVPAREG